MPARICIGTSGWAYADWRGAFYPRGLAQRNWLAYYATQFLTVELNASTYRLPQRSSIERWLASVPGDFRFAVKLSRLITHRRNLGEPRAFIDNYFAAIEPLRPKIATILAQFPPYLARDDARLATFLGFLPPEYRYAFEFRHPSWYVEETYATLRSRGVALCIHDMRGSQTPDVVTAPFGYVRCHGPVRAFTGSYSRPRLEALKVRLERLGLDELAIYFNNDRNANAVRNAKTLRELFGQ